MNATRAALAPFPDCVVHQGNLFHLPYPPETFDLVLSWGVLHHTPNTRAAFAAIAPLVRQGGLLYVMLYERTAWRHRALTELVRFLFRQLPDGARYQACRALVIRDPRWYRRISPWLKVCDGSLARSPLERSTLAFDTFDAYSPTFNHVHTQTEVRQWFFEEGCSDVVLTHPVRFTTPDAVARWGECGGAVHVRGSRAPSLLLEGSETTSALRLLRTEGYVADDAASAHAWLAHRRAQPAPQLHAPPVAAPEPFLSVPRAADFTRTITDRWRGLIARTPPDWRVERDGRLLTIAPPGAQPPFQIGISVRSVSPDPTLDSEADAAAARWFGGEQRATLVHSSRSAIGDATAVVKRYDVALGEARAEASFAYFIHGGALVQLSATSAWDAPAQTLTRMRQAFDTFVATVQLTAPRRDPAALVGELRTLAGAARGRLGRTIGSLRPVASSISHAGESATTLESCYDARLDGETSVSTAQLLAEAQRVAATYHEQRRLRPGPAQGRVVR